MLSLFSRNQRNLDELIRAWLSLDQSSETWSAIEKDVLARASRKASRYRFSTHDMEDIGVEALERLWCFLQSDSASDVRSYERFIEKIIANVCKDKIAKYKPVWTRLKCEIVETLRGRRGAKGLALWRCDQQTLGGYAIWRGRRLEWTPRYVELQQTVRPLEEYLWRYGRPRDVELPLLLGGIFNWIETPAFANELTSLVFALRQLHEVEEPSEDLCEQTACSDRRANDNDLAGAIAQAFDMLQRTEKIAFLLHLQPEVAEQLLIRLSADGSEEAALPALADSLRVSEEQLRRAIDKLPLKDLQIAELIGIRRQTNRDAQMDIINLRQKAIRFVRKDIESRGKDV